MHLLRWQKPELAAWTNYNGLAGLRNELDRLFDAPFTLGSAPALDVYEDKDNFVVKAELPGMEKGDIDVSLRDGVLSISGERKNEEQFAQAEPHRSERFFGKFLRTITLPAPVAADKIKGSYKDGILTVTLPKAEAAKPKQIDVQVN